jgi:hypothetical protein
MEHDNKEDPFDFLRCKLLQCQHLRKQLNESTQQLNDTKIVLENLIQAAHNMAGALSNAYWASRNIKDGLDAEEQLKYIEEANNKALEYWYLADKAARDNLNESNKEKS